MSCDIDDSGGSLLLLQQTYLDDDEDSTGVGSAGGDGGVPQGPRNREDRSVEEASL